MDEGSLVAFNERPASDREGPENAMLHRFLLLCWNNEAGVDGVVGPDDTPVERAAVLLRVWFHPSVPGIVQ
eukprot:3923218-Lingulodinium_polyedra.AAC.1